MLKALVEFSIRRKSVVILVAGGIIAYGTLTAFRAKLDVFPEFVQPQAVIQTEAPGLAPEQVEALVTRPVESAVNGVPYLESLRSQSIQGLSIVTVIFAEDTDILVARQMLDAQLTAVADRLPLGVKPPRATPLTSSTMDLLKIGLCSERLSPMELRTFAESTLKPMLQAVPGVASVGVMGGEVRQLQIQVRPERLAGFGLSIDDVLNAARKSTGTRGAGFIETPNQRIVLETEGQSLSPEQLGEVVVTNRLGANLRLREVADVVMGVEPKFGDALIMGRPGVLIKLLSQYGANTIEVTYAVERVLEQIKPLLVEQGVEMFPRMHRPATFIETALYHVKRSLLIGAVLVAAVLFLFLFNLRAAVITITAIPLSLLTAIIILQRMGYTLNTITLGGLAIAIGEVVDDAIIDVENIFRRLRENGGRGGRRDVAAVVLSASLEVRSAVVYATLVVVLVFVPVLTMSGLQGRMFAPLGMAYVLAILASLAVALTATPALSFVLLPGAARRSSGEPRLTRNLKAVYGRLVGAAVAHPRTVVGAGPLLLVFTVGLLGTFGGEFLPEFREGHFVVQVNAVPGTSLPEMMRLGGLITNDLFQKVKVRDRPIIETIEQQAGRAELGEDPWGPHRCELHLELSPDTPGADQADVQRQVRDVLESYPGITSEVLTFLGDRISETVTGETAAVVINLYGVDLDVLDAKAEEVARVLSGVSGAVDVRVASPPGTPQMVVRLLPEQLQLYGFKPVDVLDAVETAYQGAKVAECYEGDRVYDVVVVLANGDRRDPETIGSLLLRNAVGTTVRLDAVADVFARTGRYMVLHDGARRRQAVMCNTQGRDVTAVVAEAKQKIGQVRFPRGVYATFAGAAEERAEARNEILANSGLVGVGVVLLLASVFRNWRNLMLVLANLPFAFVGGVLGVYLTGESLSIGSLVGFVTLFGITMRNSVMMVSHYEHLVKSEGMTWGLEAVIRGASERLIPVLMTALVTGLGLLPIALGSGEIGREIEGPMAIVILGGLATSTVLNLLILPTLTLRFGRFSPKPSGSLGVEV